MPLQESGEPGGGGGAGSPTPRPQLRTKPLPSSCQQPRPSGNARGQGQKEAGQEEAAGGGGDASTLQAASPSRAPSAAPGFWACIAAGAPRRSGGATASAGLAGRRGGDMGGSRIWQLEGAGQCRAAKRSGPGPPAPTTSILPKRKLLGVG